MNSLKNQDFPQKHEADVPRDQSRCEIPCSLSCLEHNIRGNSWIEKWVEKRQKIC
jgi:hypothetical protein